MRWRNLWMSDLPSGTVTFLSTDIEGSTYLWEQNTEAMRAGTPARRPAAGTMRLAYSYAAFNLAFRVACERQRTPD